MRIFVTDGDNRATLAVTRSLGRLGHEVVVGERLQPSLAGSSRYCGGRVVYPDPVTVSEAFVDALARIVVERRIDVLIPMADITTFLVSGSRDRFEPACAVPIPPDDTIARAANKLATVELARSLGVPVPEGVVVWRPDEIPGDHPPFPLVVKPWQSRVRTAAGWQSTGVSYAVDREALERDLRLRPSHEFPVLLQERLVGPGVGVFACYHQGQAVTLFSHRRLRERPPWGGVSVLSESVALCPEASQYATRLLDALEWHGVAMVEFKRDRRDGVPKLMEINGRFWGSLQLAVDAGVDFPALLVQTVTGRPVEPQPPYRVGVRNRWLWGDVDALLLTLLGGRDAPSTGRPSRVSAIGEFLKFWGRDLHYENPKWGDLRPWFYESARWFRRG